MNYFEFYAIPVAFLLDESDLKQKYYELSRSYHPDFHTLATATEQEAVLEKSTLNNQAFKTLASFDSRLKYILDLFGKLKTEGENKVPQDFLMEMMDINESVMELEMEPSRERRDHLRNQIKEMEDQALAAISTMLRAEISQLADDDWKVITDYYLKSRYLRRLSDNIEKMLD
ncbi:MAG: Fe-S protein assembly co-chaperone HscB [Saprospiraceae bacterium]|nr:Fe-S protein assembly co-chaperone HscB [Saprospiraceae bacterium]